MSKDLQGLLNAAFDATNNALRVSTSGASAIWLNSTRFSSVLGTSAAGNRNRWPSWEINDLTSIIATVVDDCPWSSVNVDVLWTVGSPSGGNVRFALQFGEHPAGEAVANPAGDYVVAAEPAASVLVKTRLASALAVTPSETQVFGLARVGADAGDTSTATMSFFGFLISPA